MYTNIYLSLWTHPCTSYTCKHLPDTKPIYFTKSTIDAQSTRTSHPTERTSLEVFTVDFLIKVQSKLLTYTNIHSSYGRTHAHPTHMNTSQRVSRHNILRFYKIIIDVLQFTRTSHLTERTSPEAWNKLGIMQASISNVEFETWWVGKLIR